MIAIIVKCNLRGKIINTQTKEYKENLVGEFICNKCILKGYEWEENNE